MKYYKKIENSNILDLDPHKDNCKGSIVDGM